MSGGSFQYAYSRVSNFCDELNEILRERTFEVLSEERKDFSYIDESLARKLELAVQIARNTSDIMRAIEWCFSDDTSVETLHKQLDQMFLTLSQLPLETK